MLAERRKYKKVIAWSGNFGIDQYVSCNLTNEELTLDAIWEKFEEFCKPSLMRSEQGLICLQALGKENEVWLNGTMQYKHKLH